MINHSELSPLLLSVILFIAAAITTVPLDRGLERDGIALPVSETTGVPADVLLLQQTLGVFRGWAIDALWLRALERREEGALHESMQLARWITKLQPYFPRVWNFQSWLLAFEMALDSRDADQRWTWVQESIDLLRGPGLRANPLSREIHNQLSYLFWFKLGEFQDEAALYYQSRLCEQWRDILGDPVTEESAGYYVETLRAISGAPRNPDQLREQAQVSDAELLLQIDGGWEDPRRLLSPAPDSPLARLPGELREKVQAMVRRRVLERDMNMSVDLMLRISEELEFVDWRTPAAHAVYWGIQGGLRETEKGIDARLNPQTLDRVLVVSNVRIGLQQMVARGRVLLDDSGELVTILPQPGLLPLYERSLLLLTGGQGIPEELLPRVIEIVSGAVVNSWLQGEEDLVRKLLVRHDQLLGKTDRSGQEVLIDSIQDLVLHTLDEGEELPFLTMRIRSRALLARGGGGTAVEAERGEQLATLLESSLSEIQRAEIKKIALASALRSPRASAPLAVKQKIWKTLAAEEKQTLDKTTRSLLSIEARRSGVEVEKLFPGLDVGSNDPAAVPGD
ncbi:MAG: hypothetical protein VX764_04880 [Planctomycetota bacterium]|nr:hypothetical protein [Planctomycetota bacterium]